MWLGQECFHYSLADYLVASVDLPVTARVTEASADVPYLGLKLEFTPEQILAVLSHSRVGPRQPSPSAQRGMFVSPMEPALFEAVVRCVRLLDNPEDIPFLGPTITQEILYRLLQSPHRMTLEQSAMEGSAAYQIHTVITHIVNHFDQSLRIEDLADMANMSVASLHRHFKAVTAMSPIQFQKQLRLQEARRLLLSEANDAAGVAYRVGYESPSQFSREYARLFGAPPRADVRNLIDHHDQTRKS